MFLASLMVAIAIPPAIAEDPSDKPATAAVMHLANGGYASGELRDSAGPDDIRWQSPSFASAFEFPLKKVEGISWPQGPGAAKPSGSSCFELAGGDVVFGTLASLDEKKAEIDTSHWGRITIDRGKIRRISSWHDGAELLYMGPSGMAGWRESPSPHAWREEAGQPATNKEGATLWADLKLPARCAIEFEISWKTKPDFVLALGVAADPNTIQNAPHSAATIRQASRFEVWENDLVVVREAKKSADLADVGQVPAASGAGRVHLLAYLDEEKGRIVVSSTAGKLLADLQVAPDKPETLGGVCLMNKHGDVRLERLRVSRWNGRLPTEDASEPARIDRVDGSSLAGRVERFDPASREFVVEEKGKEIRVAEGQADVLSFSQPIADSPHTLRAVYQDGTRISGDLMKVQDGQIRVKVAGVEPEIACRASALRSIAATTPPDDAPAVKEQGIGKLEIEGALLKGRLIEGGGADGRGCLLWDPQGSSSSAALLPGVSGRIVYKEPPPPVVVQQRQPQPVRGGLLVNVLGTLASNPAKPNKKAPSTRSLHLRTGDIVPCEITAIDEAGVSFKSPVSDSTFVPHEKIKAVELADDLGSTLKLNKSKKERLLTLPRMQKGSPPLQMIRSRNGDYLRGRVLKLDEKTLDVEVRLDTKKVPRDRISRIIWLHPEELDPSKVQPKTPDTSHPIRVQALRSDGIRLTFTPEKFSDSTLSGKSDVLGTCRVRVGEVDQILLGDAIEKEADKLVYQQWKLKNAIEPKVASGEDGGEPSRGTEAELVGKPAPDFELSLLDGKKFHLSENKGRIVILDFWATWCGPCLQAMPQVERVAREFEDRDVRLIAVNLQESPDQIKSMMDRHKLHPAVALDRDGVVAARYAANAIPQTVIINRDGTVARLFVGGGPHFDDQLRDALKDVLKADGGNVPELPRNVFAPE